MKEYRKAVAFMLALAMCITAFPPTVFADGAAPVGAGDGISQQTAPPDSAGVGKSTNKRYLMDGVPVSDRQRGLFAGDFDAPHEGFIVRMKEQGGWAPMALRRLAPLGAGLEELADGAYKADSVEEAVKFADGANLDQIEFIQPNYSYHILDSGLAEINDPGYQEQWGFKPNPGANVEAALRKGFRGGGSRIAVLDTGIMLEHPDFAGADISAYSVFSDPTTADNNNGGSNGHGTMVSGVISAQAGNNIGIAGAADRASLIFVKIVSRGHCTTAEIIKGITRSIDEKADVISISLGITRSAVDNALKAAFDNAEGKGIISVSATGNYNVGYGDAGKKWICQPARYDSVIGVGGSTVVGGEAAVADFSQRTAVTAIAPGRNVYGISIGNDGYVKRDGTSFAAPIVAAMAGIAKSVSKSITRAGFEALLAATSNNFNTPGGFDSDIGYGLVDLDLFTEYLTTRYAITYVGDGPMPEPAYYYVTSGAVELAPSLERPGYIFLGWYDNPEGEGRPVSMIPSGAVLEKTFYAKWESTTTEPGIITEPGV
ncbi:MAG: S8 family serine peptidase, partial [Clostridiales Family XIII bacterium]|nr:S8 family serine peptidase [Clostridiales Family XIII bacterium]